MLLLSTALSGCSAVCPKLGWVGSPKFVALVACHLCLRGVSGILRKLRKMGHRGVLWLSLQSMQTQELHRTTYAATERHNTKAINQSEVESGQHLRVSIGVNTMIMGKRARRIAAPLLRRCALATVVSCVQRQTEVITFNDLNAVG